MPWADHTDNANTARVKDLRLAASFVKSIETTNHTVNLEIQRVAQQIENIAFQLTDSRPDAAPSQNA
jgi:hypothetical protein